MTRDEYEALTDNPMRALEYAVKQLGQLRCPCSGYQGKTRIVAHEMECPLAVIIDCVGTYPRRKRK